MSFLAHPTQTARLADRLRERTREANARAQRSRFIDGLAQGRLPLAAYAELAAQHWFIYESLELASEAMADDPVAGRFVFPELFRLPSLEADLTFMQGPMWHDRIVALPTTGTYCTRIREAAFDRATGYVAHHATRYLGDLAGGQWLGAKVVGAYLFRREGYRFFVFEGVEPERIRARYRDLLNTTPWSRSEQDAFLDEVDAAFQLNIAVLAELESRWT
ncbi:biliverdin-producing heme oxygenase [Actinoplanes sp. NPDC051851]|uniref:biliverdin-producing heme oxygenase n=1 Tax=Actinoplanes sp. NPDC051851 TaxID=3154753 RepID=UPI00342E6784